MTINMTPIENINQNWEEVKQSLVAFVNLPDFKAVTDPAYQVVFADLEGLQKEKLQEAVALYTAVEAFRQFSTLLLTDAGDILADPANQVEDIRREIYQNAIAPEVARIIEDVKVMQENPFINAPENLTEAYFGEPDISGLPLLGPLLKLVMTDMPLPSNLDSVLEDLLSSCGEFLSNFPGYSFTLKSDIKPPPATSLLGPSPITDDQDLEKSLAQSNSLVNSIHYIGFLIDKEKSNGKRSKDFLPVRTAPADDKTALTLGWNDFGFSLVNHDGKLVDYEDDDADGIEVPLGFGIEVTEIVRGNSGVWVGFFVSPNETRYNTSDLSKWTNDRKRMLYTKIQYVRRVSYATTPDPYISDKVFRGATPDPPVQLPNGAKLIDGTNLNWKSLEPLDVKLSYFNFSEYNKREMGDKLSYKLEEINKKPTIRFSEGYYYFIVGQGHRLTTEEIKEKHAPKFFTYDDKGKKPMSEDSEEYEKLLKQLKQQEQLASTANIKEKAFTNLLLYFNKNIPVNGSIFQTLKNDHFTPVMSVTRSSGVSPENHKVLFAIPVSYIDSLPESTSLIGENFNPETENQFFQGRDFSFALRLKEIPKIIDDLVKVFESMKQKITAFKNKGGDIKNANDINYDIDLQIESLKEFPSIIDDFLRRQAFPNSTNTDDISIMAAAGTQTTSEEDLLQIGLRDNGETGATVRKTISYVVYSPDPKSPPLQLMNDNSKLLELDPFLTADELEGKAIIRRSGIVLNSATPYLRSRLSGVQGTRTLHYIWAHKNMTITSTEIADDSNINKWAKFLQAYSLPPLKIKLSKEGVLESQQEELDCKSLIAKMRKSANVTSSEDRKLYERVLNNPRCKELLAKEWGEPTSASDPETSREAMKLKDQQLAAASGTGNRGVKILFDAILHNLDPEGLMNLLMACIQSKLGLPLTKEAICEAAIIKLIEAVGIEEIKKIMLEKDPSLSPHFAEASELLSPEAKGIIEDLEEQDKTSMGSAPGQEEDTSEWSVEVLIDGEKQNVRLNSKFKDAPMATALALSGGETDLINLILNLEKGGSYIELVPGTRPQSEDIEPLPGNLPGASILEGLNLGQRPEKYTQQEIDQERRRLLALGYSSREAEAKLVQMGYLVPNRVTYEPLLSGQTSILDPLEDLGRSLPPGPFSVYGATVNPANINTTVQDARNFLNYLKRIADLQKICEAIVGPLLDLPFSLIKGDQANWGDDFVERMKRFFKPPAWGIKFPDNLKTDNLLGDYSEMLFETFVSMVGIMIGQILNLIIKDILERCFEENDDGRPGAPEPSAGETPSIPTSLIPALLPRRPDVSALDMKGWFSDLLDSLRPGQICSLLKGEASNLTLRECIEKTKAHWPAVYNSGINSGLEISTIFKDFGSNPRVNLDICNFIDTNIPAQVDLCSSGYDYDQRCADLLETGLTEEECEEQIRREIDDLREKVLAIASFLSGERALDGLPPMCGPGGYFSLPEAAKHSMESLTDNILATVKQALMVDLQSLKFFSMPPRAVMALTDPEELEKSHKMFVTAMAKPYKKSGMLMSTNFIPKPGYLDTPSSDINAAGGPLPNYCLMYNDLSHYNFTWKMNALNKQALVTDPVAQMREELDQVTKAAKIWQTEYQKYEDYYDTTYGGGYQMGGNQKVDLELKQAYEYVVAYKHSLFTSALDWDSIFDKDDAMVIELYILSAGQMKFITQGPSVEGPIALPPIEGQNLKDTWYLPEGLGHLWDDNIFSADAAYGDSAIDLHKTLIQQSAEEYGANINPQHLLEKEKLLPITNDVFLSSGNDLKRSKTQAELGVEAYESITDSGQDKVTFVANNVPNWYETLKKYFDRTVLENNGLPNDFSNVEYSDITTIQNYYSFFQKGPEFKEMLLQAFLSEMREVNVDSLLYTPELYKKRNSQMGPPAQGQSSAYHTMLHMNGTINHRTFVPTAKYKFNDSSKSEMSGFSLLRYLFTPIPLDTRLKDLGPYYLFGPMLRMYTGVNIVELGFGHDRMNPPGQTVNTEAVKWTQSVAGFHRCPGIRELEQRWEARGYSSTFNTYSKIFHESLTIGEATGLTEERIKKLYPNHENLYQKIKGVVLEFGLSNTFGLKPVGSLLSEATPVFPGGAKIASHNGYIPAFVAYEEDYRDPSLPFNKPPDEQMEYFSLNSRKVSPQLHNNLIERELFAGDHLTTAQAGKQAFDLEEYLNFNPNSLIYPMPFVEVSSKGAVNDKSKEIIELMGSLETESSDLKTIIDDISISTEKKSLGMQNHGPQEIAFSSQESAIRDSYTYFKAKIKNLDGEEFGTNFGQTPGILGEEFSLFLDPGSKFMAGAGGSFSLDGNSMLDADLRNLLEKLEVSNTKQLFNNFQTIMKSGLDNDLRPKKINLNEEISESPYYLSPLNFKAQVFGKLLATKFKEYYDKAGGNSVDPDLEIGIDDFTTRLQYVLSTYCFSSLQYAYSNQMFKKLVTSRLNSRRFMRKLWKKMLRSSASDETLTAACQAAADEFGLMSQPDLQNAETDFFKLDQVKPKILEHYERSVCRDLADVTREPENAARAAAVEGCVMLLVKVYCLEVCLASIIAWDSFDISEIFDDETVARVVIEHMKQDISDLDPIIVFANNIVKKQRRLTNVESYLAPITTGMSALQKVIQEEGKNISTIVKGLFSNSNPLSTKMKVDILKNSDADFVRNMQRVDANIANNPDTQGKTSDIDGSKLANIIASLHSEGNVEYVVDARLKNNIYTMNYGCHSEREDSHSLYELADNLKEIDNDNDLEKASSLFWKHRTDRSDLYGHKRSGKVRPETGQVFHTTQKDYFHSLPLKHWTKSIRHMSDADRFSEKANDWHNEVRLEGSYNHNVWASGYSIARALEYIRQLPVGSHSFPAKDLPKCDWRYQAIDSLASTLRTNRVSKKNENHFESTVGNNLNAKYGNVTFEPYVKIVDATAQDRKKYISYIFSDKNPDGTVCEEPVVAATIDAAVALGHDQPVLLHHRKNLGQFLGESWKPTKPGDPQWSYEWVAEPSWKEVPRPGNFHNSYIFGYVPLHVWSHFYNNVFLQWIEEYEDEVGTKTMKILFEEHGLGPFFKEISFGIRMTYSTSFPVTEAPDLRFNEIMSTLADAVSPSGEDNCPPSEGHGTVKIGNECHRGLDIVKTLFNSRPYMISQPAGAQNWDDANVTSADEQGVNSTSERVVALNELQIPIIEVERTLEFDKDGFSFGGEKVSYDELGYFSGFTDPTNSFIPWTYEDPVQDLLQQKNKLKEIANNPHQFFYKNLAQDLTEELQSTPEFKLMYEYIFPMKKYMSLGFLYAGESLSKFIPDPTDVLDETKAAIRTALEAVLNSDDYKYVPESVRNQLADSMANMDLGTTGKEDDLNKQILKIILQTPLIVLKSFVEITDPAVMIAKAIIDIANAIQQAVIAAIEQGIRTAKQATEAAINQAKNAQIQLEVQVSAMGGLLESTANTLKSALPEEHKDKIDVQIASKPEIGNWVLKADPLTEAEAKKLVEGGVFSESQVEDYNVFAEESLPEVKALRDDYVTISQEIDDLESKKADLEKDLTEKVGKAKETAAKIFASPFLLPGIWASLMPSMLPYGGGIVPPPFVAGPPSTIPGMIYIALLLMDVYEEKLHDEAEKLKGEESCQDQL